MRVVASLLNQKPTQDKLALQSIGQGDARVTPLQNAMIAAAIANNGTLMKPTLVDCVRSSDLSVISQTTPTVMSQALSAQSAAKLNAMMQSVVVKSNQNLSLPNEKAPLWVLFHLSSAHGKDISAFSRVGGVPWQSVP